MESEEEAAARRRRQAQRCEEAGLVLTPFKAAKSHNIDNRKDDGAGAITINSPPLAGSGNPGWNRSTKIKDSNSESRGALMRRRIRMAEQAAFGARAAHLEKRVRALRTERDHATKQLAAAQQRGRKLEAAGESVAAALLSVKENMLSANAVESHVKIVTANALAQAEANTALQNAVKASAAKEVAEGMSKHFAVRMLAGLVHRRTLSGVRRCFSRWQSGCWEQLAAEAIEQGQELRSAMELMMREDEERVVRAVEERGKEVAVAERAVAAAAAAAAAEAALAVTTTASPPPLPFPRRLWTWGGAVAAGSGERYSRGKLRLFS